MDERREELTRLLRGDPASQGTALPLIYEELRQIARQRMSSERVDHTLQATALVHEAYARLIGTNAMEWRDRSHFFAAAANAMRRVLIDHARKSSAERRGGDRLRVTLGSADAPIELEDSRLVELDAALGRLEAEDPRAAEVTKLRFFVGLSVEETARTLDLSVRTVEREWTYAKARLTQWLTQ